jgi:hypothetical protein
MQKPARKIAAFKTTLFDVSLPSDTRGMATPELRTGLLLQKIRSRVATINENDALYHELELRYGCSFAQSIVDGMKKA